MVGSGNLPAKSARTQRKARSVPVKLVLVIGRAPSGLEGKQSIKYRDVSVKHATTSPSHRDRSRQVVVLRPFQDQPRPNKIVQPPPWTQLILNLLTHPNRLRNSCRVVVPISLFKTSRIPVPCSRNFRHTGIVTHIAMSLDPTFAWRASLTRTPPPICTSAPFLKPRWSQDRGRCERFKKYTMHDFRQSSETASEASLRRGDRGGAAPHESKFLNHREESRVSQISSQPQKIFIKNLSSLRREVVFQPLGVAMGISNYRRGVFRDFFSG
jgi:hypothetical protein